MLTVSNNVSFLWQVKVQIVTALGASMGAFCWLAGRIVRILYEGTKAMNTRIKSDGDCILVTNGSGTRIYFVSDAVL